MIMTKQLVTFLLAGVLCLSPVSGLLTVMCQGADGHVAFEPLFHSHCHCDESGPAGGPEQEAAGLELTVDHSHCKDLPAGANHAVEARKQIKAPILKVWVVYTPAKWVCDPIPVRSGEGAARPADYSPFYMPLRTVILLA